MPRNKIDLRYNDEEGIYQFIRDKTLFSIYFHATLYSSVSSILKSGLDAFKIDPVYLKEEGQPFVFLSPSFEGASSFVPSAKKGAIFRVCVPSYLKNKFRFDLGEFVRSPVNIPPKYLRLAAVTFGEIYL